MQTCISLDLFIQRYLLSLHQKHQEQSPLGGLANRAIGATVVSTMWKHL